MNPTRLLILSTDPAICRKFKAFFRYPVYEIRIPCTPREALAHAADPQCPVVILDTAFPGIDLSVFISRLRAQNPRIRILIAASVHSEAIEKAARWAGVLYYATKPFDFKLFRKIIERGAFMHPAHQTYEYVDSLAMLSRYGRI
jgi:DNA-binding response OmpR family regulator